MLGVRGRVRVRVISEGVYVDMYIYFVREGVGGGGGVCWFLV